MNTQLYINQHIILAGDFNVVLNHELDTIKITKNKNKTKNKNVKQKQNQKKIYYNVYTTAGFFKFEKNITLLHVL